MALWVVVVQCILCILQVMLGRDKETRELFAIKILKKDVIIEKVL